jgi:hypothetical protein
MMSTIDSVKFGRICDGVWRDRTAIQSGRGSLSGEAALIRAVYWRLCKEGVAPSRSIEDCHEGNMLPVYQRLVRLMLTQNAQPPFDGTSRLEELVRLSIDEGRGRLQDTRPVRSVTRV